VGGRLNFSRIETLGFLTAFVGHVVDTIHQKLEVVAGTDLPLRGPVGACVPGNAEMADDDDLAFTELVEDGEGKALRAVPAIARVNRFVSRFFRRQRDFARAVPSSQP